MSQSYTGYTTNVEQRISAVENLGLPTRPWVDESRTSMDSTSRSIHVVKAFPNPPTPKKRATWTPHKWWLLITNTIFFFYSLAMVVSCILTYWGLWYYAKVAVVSEALILNLMLSAGSICLFTSLLGYIGIILNSRSILTAYNVLMWPCFALIASIGYVAYRKALPSRPTILYKRLSQAWHDFFSPQDRKVVQAYLHCCGLKEFRDFPEPSNKCFPRTLLPSCQHKLHDITAQGLKIVYISAFSLIPAHLIILISALMCAHHIDRRFGKGLPPKMYRVENLGLVAGTPNGSSLDLINYRRD
ncbi:tetraspanin Tsp2 [Jimgerdemannia flammicorona]|uniref:Tetraspanin Tsp2 n=2 Tax=Jimgerdemannia flammicorona TaxID=994334 RepID=A0A433D730_9FUNG|nr:tetraspanin Tsp2 [Jimgerdemannia flammicorona]RUS31443.1 tetraspanin Tsp2 [Jimgerdemannia flammicorona]